MLFVTDRDAFSAPRLVKDGVIATLAFAYSLWAIAGSGYEVVFKGFMLLMAGLPVFVFMKWRAAKEAGPMSPEARTGGDTVGSLPSTAVERPVPERV